jgi:hypothetical protein
VASLSIALAWTVLVLPAANAADFQAGAGMQTITPVPLLPISGGMGPTAPVREKLGELTVRAVVLQSGQTRVAFVALDLLGFPRVLGDRVRSQVERIPAENILIAATHCHSAPDCYAFPDGQGGHTGDLNYIDFVCAQTVRAIHAAIADLQPASLKIGTDEAEGKIAYNYYAPDLYDRRMSVVQAIGADGQAIATLVNYAIHPEVLGPKSGILSPDLVGPLCDAIESQQGGMALFINGAQGGMITADNRDFTQAKDPSRGSWEDIQSWEECERIGQTMAAEAARIIGSVPVQTHPVINCYAMEVEFPVESDALWAVVNHSPLNYPHNDNRSITARINLVNLGNAQILSIPGEALPNIGFYLKRKMHGQHNLLFGLTNDAFGYILTKVDYDSFPRYEYISRVSLGEMTGEILIDQALQLIAQCPAPETDTGSK